MEIQKTFKWGMSHRLENHDGLCKNLHGHNYKLIVTIKSLNDKKIIPSNEGMVCDFKDLKKIINIVIVDVFDHAFVYNENDSDNKAIAIFLAKQIGQKTLALPVRTTAENMIKWIVDEINNFFSKNEIELKCIKGKLYETDDSCAIYNNE